MILFIIQCSLVLRTLGHKFMHISPHVPAATSIVVIGDEKLKALVPETVK